MPSLVLIPTEKVETVWSLVDDYLSKAVAHSEGLITLQSHYDTLTGGQRQLWIVWDKTQEQPCRAAIVTEIINGVFFIWACGGTGMKEWLQLVHDIFEQWARDHGCKSMQLWGRPGWNRALSSLSFKQTLVAMTKELTP